MTAGRPIVIIPAFNEAAHLPKLLDDLTAIGLDCELVVVDDGSTDETAAVAHAAAAADPRFRVVAQPHRGLVVALATGLVGCRAPWIARMDADDLMHRDRLRLQLAALAVDPALAGVGCHVRIVPRDGLRDGFRAYERWLATIDSPARVRAEAFVECPIVHPTLVLDRRLLERFGWRDVGWPEDYDLVLRLLAAGHRLGVVPRRLLAWRDGDGRLTRTHPRYGQDRIVAAKAAFLASGLLADVDEYILWGYGDTGRALHRVLAAHGKRASHIVELHPGRIGNVIHDAPVVHVDALPSLPRRPIVASVAGAEPRALIRAALARLGRLETRDFVCAA